MLLTVEAMTDENGNIRLLDAARLPVGRRAFVTVLDEFAPTKSNGHGVHVTNEMSDEWKAFFAILDEIAEEDDLIDSRPISMTEEFLQSRR